MLIILFPKDKYLFDSIQMYYVFPFLSLPLIFLSKKMFPNAGVH